MTAGYIDHITASAPDTVGVQTFKRMPDSLTAGTLVKTLESLGLVVPSAMVLQAGQGGKLRDAGHRFTVKEVDAALSKAGVPISDRFRLKAAMTANQILGN
jgi:hypothetical protein